jgi:histidinol-phosphatase (PHP family)
LDQIHVFIGLEIDYIPGYELDDKLKRALPSLDYIIGSVHFSGKRIGDLMWTVDYTKEELLEGIRVSYEGDSQKAIKAYFQHVSEMVETIRPKIVGHLDLIKKSNEAMILFDEGDQWYREAVCECLDRIEKAGSIVEINTGGKSRGYSNEYYPSVWIIHEMLKRNIPVTISADAHATETVDYDFHKAAQLLERIGYRQIHYLTNTGWETVDVRRLT